MEEKDLIGEVLEELEEKKRYELKRDLEYSVGEILDEVRHRLDGIEEGDIPYKDFFDTDGFLNYLDTYIKKTVWEDMKQDIKSDLMMKYMRD